MKPCTSSGVMGFHQSLSRIWTLPLRVPSFLPVRTGFFVRTISTTGTPRRQMVTDSPSSTALISFGSLFFASATLSCIRPDHSHLRWPCQILGRRSHGMSYVCDSRLRGSQSFFSVFSVLSVVKGIYHRGHGGRG